jgi:hypothetical protein
MAPLSCRKFTVSLFRPDPIFKTCQLSRTICGNRAVRLCRASGAGVTLKSVVTTDSGATRSSTTKQEERYGGKD